MSKQFTPEEAEAELARVRKILDDRGVAYERETFSRDDVGAAGAALLLAEIRKHEQTLSTYADGAADMVESSPFTGLRRPITVLHSASTLADLALHIESMLKNEET